MFCTLQSCTRTLLGASPVLSLLCCGYWLSTAHQNWDRFVSVVWQHVKTRVDAPVGGHSQESWVSVKDLSNHLSMGCAIGLIEWTIKQTNRKLEHSTVLVALLPPFVCHQALQHTMVSPSQMSWSAFLPSLTLSTASHLSQALRLQPFLPSVISACT